MLARQFLTVQLAGERYGMPTCGVREIIEYGALTSVPLLPPALRGVINLRGAAVPVLDLGMRLHNQLTQTCRRSCIVVLESRIDDVTEVFGVVVDAVCEVLEIAAEDIEPAPRFGASIRTDFIHGMARQGAAFVILLDMDRVLGEDDRALLAAATAA
ncbi:MAG: chemotaxis protein CheW [Pseudomonas oryzihabitans]